MTEKGNSEPGVTEQRNAISRDTASRNAQPRKYGSEVVATRVAVRRALRILARDAVAVPPLVLVGLSGGADSLALALATAYEATRCGVRAGAVVVDHGLQTGSADVAETAAAQARRMGLDPVVVERVRVAKEPAQGGPEAAARDARYTAFIRAAQELDASAILTAHTRDDQAEQVLLGLARGSGLRSLSGMPRQRLLSPGVFLLRPFLAEYSGNPAPAITRVMTEAACNDQGYTYWQDPHNADLKYARVRVRERVLPVLEAELGPGVAAALTRTADLVREDAEALDEMAYGYARGLLGGDTIVTTLSEWGTEVSERQPEHEVLPLSVAVVDLEGLARPVLTRVIRVIAQLRFGAYFERSHTLAVAALVTEWRGQGTVYVPRIAVTREAGELHFVPQLGSPRHRPG